MVNIQRWADAHANLPPPGQGGSAYADGASSEATKREKRRPSLETEVFLFPESAIDPGTIQAYLEREYRVHGEPGFTLRVGQASAYLLSAHKRQRADSSAFLTASNPISEWANAADNATRQAALAEELSRRSLVFLPGVGKHPSNGWPGEDSFLVFGLTLEAAKVLSTRFEQNGFVWSGADAVPQLILLR